LAWFHTARHLVEKGAAGYILPAFSSLYRILTLQASTIPMDHRQTSEGSMVKNVDDSGRIAAMFKKIFKKKTLTGLARTCG